MKTWDQALRTTGLQQLRHPRAAPLQLRVRSSAAAAGQVDGLMLEGPFERALAMHLLRFGDAVASATNAYRPNLLCDYLYETANIFNRFYREVPVLKADSDEQRTSRLALVEATARILGAGFDMLGIRPLGRM